jgi:hypothetical protein
MQTWEYKTIKVETKGVFGGILDENEFEEQLDQLAEQGWELVVSLDTNQMYGTPCEAVAVLKRLRGGFGAKQQMRPPRETMAAVEIIREAE